MKRSQKLYAADLFCGAGGTSTGLLEAARELGLDVQLIAVNHWDIAIATHSLNHPNVKHVNSDLEKVDPLEVVPGGKLHILVASPECTHFSKARGGKPMSKQSRASVKYILRWVNVLDVENVLIENVAEFMDWGPLHRKGDKANTPIKNRKGEYFHRFIRKLQDCGYVVKWRVLNAADYGDPTTRKRLFIMASKGRSPIFPEPTHRKIATDMFGTRPTWRPARDIIDWSIKGESIFQRKRPLAPNTMRRIMAGIRKFGGKAFVIGQQSGAVARDVDQPLPTVAGAGAISFIEPFIVTTNWTATNRSQPRSVDDPIPAITGQGQIGLAEPFVIMLNGTSDKALEKSNRSVNEPLPTVTGTRHAGLVEPFIIPFFGERDTQHPRTHSIDEPLPTITSHGAGALVESFIMPVNHGPDERTHSLNDPMPTITSVDAWSLIEPFLVEYHGTGSASSVDSPLKTQTGRDRFGLVQPMVFEQDGKKYLLDIRFRMLQPHELAAAMSFPPGYKFSGNREQVVKQIGNAVPKNQAKALCRAHLSYYLN
jgi:DNA (cytosine-5)-methyltransferase 1